MDVGVFVPLGNGNASAEILRAVGRETEERGFESIWVPEHVVLFDDYESPYPYSPDGKFPGGADSGMLEPLGALTYLAAVPTGSASARASAWCLNAIPSTPQKRSPISTHSRVVGSTSVSVSAGCARSSRPWPCPSSSGASAPTSTSQ